MPIALMIFLPLKLRASRFLLKKCAAATAMK
jgi:hypothetical protein